MYEAQQYHDTNNWLSAGCGQTGEHSNKCRFAFMLLLELCCWGSVICYRCFALLCRSSRELLTKASAVLSCVVCVYCVWLHVFYLLIHPMYIHTPLLQLSAFILLMFVDGSRIWSLPDLYNPRSLLVLYSISIKCRALGRSETQASWSMCAGELVQAASSRQHEYA